ncbi:hypothetical protein LJC18_02120 [Lachnospiraceae bacterium OttesenSCG-928-E19]|nr:hypothetical protein [Lachnospiraceae bacterium OttesenSCG-928-E19]
MIKRILMVSVLSAIAVSGANAGFYVGGNLRTITDSEFGYDGHTINRSDIPDVHRVHFGDEISIEGTIGYAFENGLRFEYDLFRLFLRDANSDDNSFSGTFGSGAFKGFYDFKNKTKFTPYIGVGAWKFAYSGDTGLDFDIIGLIGISYAITDHVLIDLQYGREWERTQKSDLLNIGYNAVFDNGTNWFKMGARYMF